MSDAPSLTKCFLCGWSFQYGPHVYAGRPIPEWGRIMVCNRCRHSNHDGIPLGRFPHLERHLQSMDIEVKLNAQGWIGWPGPSD
jgi:hypothetical protein